MRRAVTSLAVLATLLGWALWRLQPAFAVATGLTSHELCDGVFVADQAPQVVFRTNLAPRQGYHWIAWAIRYRVDYAQASVTSSLLGAYTAKAVYRKSFGCLVLHGAPPVTQSAIVSPAEPALLPPLAGRNVVAPQNAKLRVALDAAFDAPQRRTEAVVVVHDGHIIAERYAPGFGVQTPLIGYSATKSVISALIGILVREKRLSLYGPAPVALWDAGGNKRRAISIDDLLRMMSGLDFPETDSGLDRPSQMLFLKRDMAAYAERTRLRFPPGTHWSYSSASYLILSQIIRNAVGGGPERVLSFARRTLFGPLGMTDVHLDFDATGTPVGSTYMLAPARSWARFGMLYLDDGVVDGQRILPAGWVRYSTTPSPDTGYGAGFWTERVGKGANPYHWGLPDVPADSFMARGILGQFVVVIPSKDLVVVRFGLTDQTGANVNDSRGMGQLVAAVVAAINHSSWRRRIARAVNVAFGTRTAFLRPKVPRHCAVAPPHTEENDPVRSAPLRPAGMSERVHIDHQMDLRRRVPCGGKRGSTGLPRPLWRAHLSRFPFFRASLPWRTLQFSAANGSSFSSARAAFQLG